MRGTGVKIQDVAAAMDTICPLSLAQDWDNVGLLIGDPNARVRQILVTIDTTPAVVKEARRIKADLILSYHPVLFNGVKRITAQGPDAHIYELIRAGIGVFSFHTAYDVVPSGVNDALAEAVGIADPKPIGDFVADPESPAYKLITFVPQDAVNAVADAMYEAGAGRIGHYSHCGFQSAGQGTFLPLDGAKPTIGQQGQREIVPEIKLETVVQADRIDAVVAALRRAHPYETPAFDVFRHYDLENRLGLGRMGRLTEPARLDVLLERIKQETGARAAGIVGEHRRMIRQVAVCAGSCGRLIQTVVAQDCDLYITGELKHHLALHAQQAGLTCVCLSHSVSERFALKKLIKQLKKRLPKVKIRLSAQDRDPFEWKSL
jgi:dinuclear metal center YbgI/SA1388 family protein